MATNYTLEDGEEVREALAAQEHERWSGWMNYLFSKCTDTHRLKEGTHSEVEKCKTIPGWAVERWMRQAATSYADLTEAEKESDRAEADKTIKLLDTLFSAEVVDDEAS